MGQYYMAYVRSDEEERLFCPQNAIFMTRNGLGPNDEAKHVYDFNDPNSWGSCFSGLKLMEHSWLENDFVNGVLEAIWDKPCKVAWVGDYADHPSDFDDRYTEQVYEAVWGEEKLTEIPFDEVPTIHKAGFLVNHDKRQFVDLERYANAAGFSPKWDEGNVWVTHPLPLLTAIGNGRGGGDYHGTNMGMVGSWAMDLLSFTEERPSGMDEILIPFIEG